MSLATKMKNEMRRMKYGSLSYFEDFWSVRSKKSSYSQSGEDLILKFALNAMGISNPIYLDIGAYHPFKYSNTYLFYLSGAKGVNIEPDPSRYCNIQRKRPRDLSVNCGVDVVSSPKCEFFIMSQPTLSTFSKHEALRLDRLGLAKILKTIDVPVRTINEFFSPEFAGEDPDIVSIDVEGLDLDLARSIDFQRFRPKTLCIETLSYSRPGEEIKSNEISKFMENQGYITYADTYINTIFVDAASWEMRGR